MFHVKCLQPSQQHSPHQCLHFHENTVMKASTAFAATSFMLVLQLLSWVFHDCIRVYKQSYLVWTGFEWQSSIFFPRTFEDQIKKKILSNETFTQPKAPSYSTVYTVHQSVCCKTDAVFPPCGLHSECHPTLSLFTKLMLFKQTICLLHSLAWIQYLLFLLAFQLWLETRFPTNYLHDQQLHERESHENCHVPAIHLWPMQLDNIICSSLPSAWRCTRMISVSNALHKR